MWMVRLLFPSKISEAELDCMLCLIWAGTYICLEVSMKLACKPYINKIQQDATVCRCLFTAKSLWTCFGCPSHPSSREHKTVTAASGTGHTVKYKSLNYKRNIIQKGKCKTRKWPVDTII